MGELGGEGIVSKRADAAYTSGPSSTWLKCKQSSVGTFAVIGYVPEGKHIEAFLTRPEPRTRDLVATRLRSARLAATKLLRRY